VDNFKTAVGCYSVHPAGRAVEQVTIRRRFRGPHGSGNGGYVAGVLADHIDGAAQVTIRKPPPLEQPLELQTFSDQTVTLSARGFLIANAIPATVDLEPPCQLRIEDAVSASAVGALRRHPFPGCFVCGSLNKHGLRIFPGHVAGTDVVAAPWTPALELAGAHARVLGRYVWAALDCPGAFAVTDLASQAAVLGRLTAELRRPILCGCPYIVLGWPLGRDGRKLFAGTAILTTDGHLAAIASATWFEVEANSEEDRRATP
jgi:hypothetical protein